MKAREVAQPMAMTVLIFGDESLITLQQTHNTIRVVSHKALLCRPYVIINFISGYYVLV